MHMSIRAWSVLTTEAFIPGEKVVLSIPRIAVGEKWSYRDRSVTKNDR